MHDHFGLSNIKIVYWLRVLASRAKKLKLHFLACRIFIVNRMFKNSYSYRQDECRGFQLFN